MENLSLNIIREKYLNFFESKGHLRMPSFSLVPKNDASLLLINSGMAPLKPYFTGAEVPPRKRVTTCQKCIRTPDIENVGKTARHGTFFEMLGNFSFGDYFKKEVIPWAWEFLTKEMGIPAERLYITVYKEDDEAFDIWNKEVGVPESHIYRMGKEDNFWEHGTGPCGPCSEIHFDRGAEYGCGKPDCRVGCSCDRYLEVWNLVFSQFDRQEDGSYKRLAQQNIDTGMGLERLAVVMQGVDNLFEVDTVRKILDTVCEMSGKKYGENWDTDVSIRVVTDHIRSTVMMISDGVIPSNEARGYVLRRLLRRAARHGRKLGIKGTFLHKLADVVNELSGDAYPNIREKIDYIKKIIKTEEERFGQTLEQGLALLGTEIDELKASGEKVLSGDKAFKLHDTYGFPLDITKDVLMENGLELDEEGFKAAMAKQKAMAREAIKDRESSWAGNELHIPVECPKTIFTGYDELESSAKVLYLLQEDGTETKSISEGEAVVLITDRTSLYGESGGQEGDKGVIETKTGKFEISSVTKTKDGIFKHLGTCTSGEIKAGDVCTTKSERTLRLATERNHSATHLLQKALRTVLGDHVHQAGSSNNPERLRFDFNHTQALTKEELARVEELVNNAILADYPVVTEVLPIDEAKKLGAMALFDEKYGDKVRVVKMGDYSLEFCGGTHVKSTATIGAFRIVHETAVAAGVRRIEAITGLEALKSFKADEAILEAVIASVKATKADVVSKVDALIADNKALSKEIDKIKMDAASKGASDVLSNAKDVNGIKVVTGRFDALDGNALRDLAESLRSKMGEVASLVVLASGQDSKVSIVAMASKQAVAAKVSAGNVVREAAKICGGGGGGRPDMAQAGGKDASKIDEMLASVPNLI